MFFLQVVPSLVSVVSSLLPIWTYDILRTLGFCLTLLQRQCTVLKLFRWAIKLGFKAFFHLFHVILHRVYSYTACSRMSFFKLEFRRKLLAISHIFFKSFFQSFLWDWPIEQRELFETKRVMLPLFVGLQAWPCHWIHLSPIACPQRQWTWSGCLHQVGHSSPGK